MSIRILIADAQDMFREALICLLESQKDFLVIGDSNDGDATYKMVSDRHPDILLMDLNLRTISGLDLLHQIAPRYPQLRPLLLTDSTDPGEIVPVLLSGGRGLLHKNIPSHILFKSIRSVMDSEYWISHEEVVELVKNMCAFKIQLDKSSNALNHILTCREQQIVDAIESGATNGEIARELSLSERTVKYHLTHIFSKLGVTDRIALAHYALRHRHSTYLCSSADCAQ